MLFLHPWLLAGLAGVAIPIIIHLVRRQAAKPIDWGAMRFLFDTVAVRRRRIEWEDLLLMAARCLLLGLVALAIARPFVTPDSGVPWLFVLPAALLGIALFGGSFVIEGSKARWLVRAAASLLVLTAAGLVVFEKILNLRRFEAGGRRDVALVIDASSSMELMRGGRSVFDQALEDARRIVTEAPRGTAFTVILGGPAPQALTRNPVTHRADVLEILESLQPVGGSFRAHEALGMATLVLAQGDNSQKEIIVITDSQRTGWRFDEPAAWRNLASAWDSLPAKPKVMLRDMGGPETFRNVMVSHPELSRPLVGTDREVLLRATVTNTGREPLAPGPVALEIDGARCGESSVGLLAAGQSETVEFSHRFTKRGPAVAVVRIDPKDDLASDDIAELVVSVRGGLPVLLVDGNPSVSFFERAAGYPALALAPSASLVRGDKPGDGFLMAPRVVAAGALTDEDLTDAAVIVLADVPRLPERLSSRIAERVSAGAGLLIIAGPRAESAFYNQWQGSDGPVCPAPLGEESVDPDGVQPAAATFRHEALKRFADDSDLSAATVRRWRKTGDPVEGAAPAAALASGDAFLTASAYGKGRVMLASCAFDARSGNLPARRSFVPLMHELVMWTAGGGVELNVSATWSPAAILGSNSGGLAGEYLRRKGGEKTRQPFRRVDPNIDFDWGGGKPDSALPSDGFSVRWTGFIIAPTNGSYLFEAEADDRISLRIEGDEIITAEDGARAGCVTLKAGKPVSVDVQYEEDQGEARARLYWTPPGETRQVVPPSALMPGLDAELEKLLALDPRGIERPASLRAGRRGIEASVDGAAVPGVYRIRGGGALKDAFDFGEATSLPLVVRRDAGESVFEPMLETDLALMRRHADILLPGTVEDVLAVLRGKGFGREIWKLLAVAALVLMVLESVLARWVSKSRGAAGSVEVDFGGSVVWRGGRR